MRGRYGKKAWYLIVVFGIGLLALWGCPKKAEISAVPEIQQEEKPAIEATARTEEATPSESEAAAPEDEEAAERSAAAHTGLQPVYFDFDQALIEAEAGEIMKANAEWLKANPHIKVRIEGHCDERGTIEYNQTLGQRRAANAKKYLTDMGISDQRISLISYGKEMPSCAENTESCWQKNRRGDFAVVSAE